MGRAAQLWHIHESVCRRVWEPDYQSTTWTSLLIAARIGTGREGVVCSKSLKYWICTRDAANLLP